MPGGYPVPQVQLTLLGEQELSGQASADRGRIAAQSSSSKAGAMLPPLPTHLGLWDRLKQPRTADAC